VTYLSVAVNASGSSDPDGTILVYAWNWGDGTTGTGVTATHAYATAGSKTITLTVTDNSGMTGTTSKIVTTVLPPAPVAAFTTTTSGLTVNVNASLSTGTGLTYSWNWSDGTAAGTGVTATHTYASSAMVIHVSSGGRVPPTPHAVYGFTYGPDGITPITDCAMTFTVVRTGETILYTQEAGQSAYVIDMSMFTVYGYQVGDFLRITATAPGYNGTTTGVLTAADQDQFDVVLQPTGKLVTITLTVTDQFGRTASVSHTYMLNP
jgi:chitodextrinase